MNHKKYFFIILISIAVVFSPMLVKEYCFIDDLGAIKAVRNTANTNFTKLLVTHAREGAYYRPLLSLSQFIDCKLWNFNPIITHLENLLLHSATALLVYLLVWLIVPDENRKISRAPLLASLLFALHPMATESVCWYSGRTDLLAGIFIFAAACLTVAWSGAQKHILLLSAVIMIMIGSLAKETALAGLVMLPFLCMKEIRDETPVSPHSLNYKLLICLMVPAILIACVYFKFWPSLLLAAVYFISLHVSAIKQEKRKNIVTKNVLIKSGIILILLVSGVALLAGIRFLAFSSVMSRFDFTYYMIANAKDFALGLFISAQAFYAKKFFFPLPQSFFIQTIDPVYYIIGVAMIFAVVELWFRRNREVLLVITGLIFILPSLPLTFGTMAWTPYAERYVYISTGFWSAATALYISRAEASFPKLKNGLLVIIILFFGVTTYGRCLIWQNNETLKEDTARKSDTFRKALEDIEKNKNVLKPSR